MSNACIAGYTVTPQKSKPRWFWKEVVFFSLKSSGVKLYVQVTLQFYILKGAVGCNLNIVRSSLTTQSPKSCTNRVEPCTKFYQIIAVGRSIERPEK